MVNTTLIPQIMRPWLAMAIVVTLLLLGSSFGAERPGPPPGQPAQIWSKVDYDSKLTDPFFESNEWSYPWSIIKHLDGSFEDITSNKRPDKEPPHMKHTAKCFITALERGRDKDLVKFCKARLLDTNMIDLLIHENNPAYTDALRVQIRNGMFSTQYWASYKRALAAACIWTTKRQKLTLDKKVYRKGDVIKGRIDFECVEEKTNPEYIKQYGRDPSTIKVYGVFKTILK
jgi:hypothetical protein